MRTLRRRFRTDGWRGLAPPAHAAHYLTADAASVRCRYAEYWSHRDREESAVLSRSRTHARRAGSTGGGLTRVPADLEASRMRLQLKADCPCASREKARGCHPEEDLGALSMQGGS